MRSAYRLLGVAALAFSLSACAIGGPPRVRVGWAHADISPDFPVDLLGQMHQRRCNPDQHHDPVTATVLALESESGSERAILVSLDLVWVHDMADRLRDRVAPRIKDFDPKAIVMFATHTHTGPYPHNDSYYPYIPASSDGDRYREFMLDKVADAVVAAWERRDFGGVSTSQVQADVGYNRIVVYTGGNAQMYGNPFGGDFKELEGPNDPRVEVLYTWDADRKVTGILINVAAPSQICEQKNQLSADYWHEVRKQIRESAPELRDLPVMAMCSAAGDQCPRNLQDSTRSHDQKTDWPETVRVGGLIAQAVLGKMPEASSLAATGIAFDHETERLALPKRPEHGGTFETELHAIRIGDVAIVNNPFELYIEYGMALKAASPARQTFIAQLSGMPRHGGYLPTEKALKGTAYGSRPENGQVGPEGGRMLVERTVSLLRKMWGSDVQAAASAP